MPDESNGFESFSRPLPRDVVKKIIKQGIDDYNLEKLDLNQNTDDLPQSPLEPPNFHIDKPKADSSEYEKIDDRVWRIIINEASQKAPQQLWFYKVIRPDITPITQDSNTRKDYLLSQKSEPEDTTYQINPDDRFKKVFGKDPDSNSLQDKYILMLLGEKVSSKDKELIELKKKVNLNHNIIVRCVQDQLDRVFERKFAKSYDPLNNIYNLEVLFELKIKDLILDKDELKLKINQALREYAKTDPRIVEGVSYTDIADVDRLLELVDTWTDQTIEIDRTSLDAVLAKELTCCVKSHIAQEKTAFATRHKIEEEKFIKTWNRLATRYGLPLRRVIDEVYISLFSDTDLWEKSTQIDSNAVKDKFIYLQKFSDFTPTAAELTQLARIQGKLDKDESIEDILQKIVRDQYLFGNPNTARLLERKFDFEFSFRPEEVQAMYARIFFDRSLYDKSLSSDNQNEMQDLHDNLLLKSGILPAMEIIDAKYIELLEYGLGRGSKSRLRNFYEIVKVEPSESFARRIYGEVLKNYVNQDKHYEEDGGESEEEIFKRILFSFKDIKEFTGYDVRFDEELFATLTRICVENGNLEYKLPFIARIFSEFSKAPPIFNTLKNNWRVKSEVELFDFLQKNVDYAHLLFENPDKSPLLTKDDMELTQDIRLRMDELEFIKRSGKDLAALAASDNFKDIFNTLTETHPSWQAGEIIAKRFALGAKVFGYEKMFLYIDREGLSRYNALASFDNIIRLYEFSELTSDEFYENILDQVINDNEKLYDNYAQANLARIANNIDPDVGTVLQKASGYVQIEQLQEFVSKFSSPKQVFSSWKNLKDYESQVAFLNKVQTIEKHMDTYPKNSSLTTLVKLSEIPQIGELLVSSLRGLTALDFNLHVDPIIAAQGSAAFLFFDRIRSFPNAAHLSNKDTEYIVHIAKKYGTQARNILENLLTHVPSVSEEAPMIDAFIDEIGIIDIGLYKHFKLLKDRNDTEGIRNIKESITNLQNKVYNGTMGEEDFRDNLYPAISYFTFPPAVGITQHQYYELSQEREDLSRDIPEQLADLQYNDFSVRTGKYILGEDKQLELGDWEVLSDVVKKVNKEIELNGLVTIDEDSTAESLIELFKTKGTLKAEGRPYLFECMYRYNIAHGGGKLDVGYELSLPGLMKYKEFVGEQMKNNLIRDCLEKYSVSHPAQFNALKTDVMNRLKNQQQQNIGIVKSMLTGIRRQTSDDERAKAIRKLNDFLRKYNLSYEGIKDLPFEEYSKDLLVAEEQDTNFLIFRKISSDLVADINNDMRKEVEKFEFTSTNEGKAETRQFQFVISKKREHGVAGYNMGVCVTPDQQLWADPEFMNLIIFDPKTKQAMGGIHLLIRENNLTLPGINPSLDLLATVNNQELYDEIIKFTLKIKEKLGLHRLLIPAAPVIHSNRTQMQEIIRGKNYNKYQFERVQPFSYDPYEYFFQEAFEVN